MRFTVSRIYQMSTGITVLLGSSDKKSNCLWLYWGKVHRLPLELQSGSLEYSIGGHICQF